MLLKSFNNCPKFGSVESKPTLSKYKVFIIWSIAFNTIVSLKRSLEFAKSFYMTLIFLKSTKNGDKEVNFKQGLKEDYFSIWKYLTEMQ